LKILNLRRFFAFRWLDNVTFLDKMLGLERSATGEFFVKAAVGFDDPPERRDVFDSFTQIFLCRLRDNPEENAGA